MNWGERGSVAARGATGTRLDVPPLLPAPSFLQVRILAVPLAPTAYEAAARACADGGDVRKAVELLRAAAAAGGGGGAARAVFSCLARDAAADPALALLDELGGGWEDDVAAFALNAAARACARAARPDDGLRLLADLKCRALRVDTGTYDALALACLSAGRPADSEELLEERDYL